MGIIYRLTCLPPRRPPVQALDLALQWGLQLQSPVRVLAPPCRIFPRLQLESWFQGFSEFLATLWAERVLGIDIQAALLTL